VKWNGKCRILKNGSIPKFCRLGSRTGQNKELCFSSFNNKKKKVIDKRFRGYAG
jgi:hypothetical protein